MRISIIGLGTVGQGVVELLRRHREEYARRTGRECVIVAALVREASRVREHVPGGALLTDDVDRFFGVASDVVVEVAGGVERALGYCRRALESGRDVVTANKALLAVNGPELFALAESRRRRVLFEAAVAGGVPIIRMLTDSLVSGQVREFAGIVNGTCNFILSRMERGEGFDEAVREAQRLGYAEADPSLDVSGDDSLQKACILASIAFGVPVTLAQRSAFASEGIERITRGDIESARREGGVVKLVARGRRLEDGSIGLHNGPMFVPDCSPLARIDGADMGVMVRTDSLARMFIGGEGAGRFPTASAVVADILQAARLLEFRDGWPLNAYPHAAATARVRRIDGPRVAGLFSLDAGD